MSRIIGAIAGAVGAIFLIVLAINGMRTIDAGEVGVFKYQPYLFGRGHVDTQIVTGPDRAYMWPSTSLIPVSIAPQTLTVHAEDFMTSDRVPLDFDVAITLRVTEPAKAPELIQRFGQGTVPVFRTLVLQQSDKTAPTGELMSYLRDQVRHYHSAVFIAAQNEDGTPSDSASMVETQTREHVNAFLARNGASLIQVENIALGRANPPDGVKKTIETTAQQAQEVKTQHERTRAAEARKAAEIATAEADQAYLQAMGLSGEQFIALEQLKVQREVCKTNTCVFTGAGQMPIALPAPTQRAAVK